MNVLGVNGDRSLLDLYDLSGTQATDATSATTSAADTVAPTASSQTSDSASFSKLSDFFSKLQQLQSSDPAKFKEICADIAEKLKAAAQQLGDTPGGKMLSDLAAKFESAAQTGDVSQLKPPAAGKCCG